MADKIEFDAVLKKIPDMNAAYIIVPFNTEEVYGKKSNIRIKATIDNVPYRGSLMDMGLGTMMGITHEIRKKINKNPGDKVHIALEQDLEERTVDIPESVAMVFSEHTEIKPFFDTLSFTNRKEYIRWITDAKREETRQIRLEKMVVMLRNKKRNPSEK